MPTTAILETKALVCGTWGQAATMPTMPARAFCGRIPKGIQLIKEQNWGVLGPSGLTCIPRSSLAAKAPKGRRDLYHSGCRINQGG